MKKLILLFAIFCLAACSRQDYALEDQENVEEASADSGIFVAGRANVKFTEEFAAILDGVDSIDLTATKAASYLTSLEELGIVSMTRLFPDAGIYEARSRKEGLHRWYKIVYDKSVSMTKAQNSLDNLDVVEICESVPKRTSCATTAYYFNDSYLNKQWGLYNDGSKTNFVADVDINVVPLWKEGVVGSSDVIVSVVDGGISKHKDLDGVVDYDNSYNFVDMKTTTVGHCHGTHVAGIIGALSNNDYGIAGIAGGNVSENLSGVKIISSQVFRAENSDETDYEADDETADDFEAAIKWGADHGAVISNNSWGNSYKTESQARNATTSSSMKAAIDYFNKYAGMSADGTTQVGPMAGGVVFFAAGNDGWAYAHPADYEGCVAVGAIGPSGSRTSYSNYGSWVDICAPGGESATSGSTSGYIISLYATSGYLYMCGTSQASPMVAGVAALVVSHCGGQGFTREDLLEALYNTSNTTLVSTTSKIGGLVDAYNAVHYFSSSANPVTTAPLTDVNSNSVTVKWVVPADSEGNPVKSYRVYYGKSQSGLGDEYVNATAGNAAVGEYASAEITGLDFSTTYYTAVSSYSSTADIQEMSPVASFTTGENHAPEITLETTDLSFKSHVTGLIEFSFSDPDGHDVTATFDGGDADGASVITTSSSTASIYVDCLQLNPGTYTGTLTATDEYGLTATKDVTFTVEENHAPEYVSDLSYLYYPELYTSQTISCANLFNDEDGEDLVFSYLVSNSKVITVKESSSDLVIYSLNYGTVDLTITAKDARGEKASVTLKVLCRAADTAFSTYYNSSEDVAYFRTGVEEATAKVTIYTTAGAEVLSYSGTASAFNPLAVSLADCAPGIYKAVVTYGGKSYESQIVKY